MVVTTTGIGFSLSAIGLAFCGFWFFNAFQKVGGLRSGSRTGILLSIVFLGSAFQHLLLGIGCLFFGEIPDALYATLVIDHLVLTLTSALGVYLAFYILLPRISYIPAVFGTIALGLFIVGMIIFTHPHPFIVHEGVDWNLSPMLSMLVMWMLFINIGPLFILFSKNYFSSQSSEVKIMSLAIMTFTGAGLFNVMILFSKLLNESLGIHFFDRVLIFIGMGFILTFFIWPICSLLFKYLSKQFRL